MSPYMIYSVIRSGFRRFLLQEQCRNVINDARQDQRAADIERRDSRGPFQRVGFPVGRAERHNAGNIEGAGAHERQRFRFADDIRHSLTEHGIVRRHIERGTEGRIQHRAVPDKGSIQHAQNRFLGEGRADESHKRPPPQAEYPRYRLDRRSDLIEKAVRHNGTRTPETMFSPIRQNMLLLPVSISQD